MQSLKREGGGGGEEEENDFQRLAFPDEILRNFLIAPVKGYEDREKREIHLDALKISKKLFLFYIKRKSLLLFFILKIWAIEFREILTVTLSECIFLCSSEALRTEKKRFFLKKFFFPFGLLKYLNRLWRNNR